MDIHVSPVQGRQPVTAFRLQGDLTVTTREQLEQKARDAHAADARPAARRRVPVAPPQAARAIAGRAGGAGLVLGAPAG